MSAWAKPGVRCVCVEANWSLPGCLPFVHRWPMEREVLTVTDVRVADSGIVSLLFGEIPVYHGDGWSWGWDARYFRPLAYKPQSLEHDVAKFRDAPAHAPVLESEGA